jgi:transketolase
MFQNNEIKLSKERCKKFRLRILEVSQQVSALHIAPAFSCLEILDSIYYYLLSNPINIDSQFILSKGHGAIAQYIILEELGILKKSDIDMYCLSGGILGAHPDRGNPGIAASTGSLGHGIGLGVGVSYGNLIQERNENVYVLVSDGELQEGSSWEGLMMASNLNLNNLIVFVDLNDFGGLHRMSEHHKAFYPLDEKFKSFGWETKIIDGHDVKECVDAVKNRSMKKPFAVICNTVKGKGVSYMENVPIWHYRSPNENELKIAIDEIKNS